MKTNKSLALFLIILAAGVITSCYITTKKGKVVQEVSFNHTIYYSKPGGEYNLATWIYYDDNVLLVSSVNGSATELAEIKKQKFDEATEKLNMLNMLNQPVK